MFKNSLEKMRIEIRHDSRLSPVIQYNDLLRKHQGDFAILGLDLLEETVMILVVSSRCDICSADRTFKEWLLKLFNQGNQRLSNIISTIIMDRYS